MQPKSSHQAPGASVAAVVAAVIGAAVAAVDAVSRGQPSASNDFPRLTLALTLTLEVEQRR